MRRAVLLVLVLVAGACGRLSFEPLSGDGAAADGAASDGAAGDGTASDGGFAGSSDLYIKPSNTDAQDQFGASVAISADGNTFAIGSRAEASGAIGIDGNQADESAPGAGAVYVFSRASAGAPWTQEAYVKASNPDTSDRFGNAIALSSDGTTLAVGAANEASAATGVDGNQADNTAASSGAVYVFTRAGASWSQQAYLKASNAQAVDGFGAAVALSSDGATLAVGAPGEDSASTGIGGNQQDNSAASAGAVYVFKRAGGTWSQQAYVKASNTGAGDEFGAPVALSGDGTTLAVAALFEASVATGIDGDQADNSQAGAGAVYVYTAAGAIWTQEGYAKPSNTPICGDFGSSLALSGSGDLLVVGAMFEAGASSGIDGDQITRGGASGAVYGYTRTAHTWSQEVYIKASNRDNADRFGSGIAVTPDGTELAVGAMNESSAATGVGGDQADDSATSSGAVYLFSRGGSGGVSEVLWLQTAYVKASNTGTGDNFGVPALSASGRTLVVGALNESGAGSGIGAGGTDNSATFAGAAYVIE